MQRAARRSVATCAAGLVAGLLAGAPGPAGAASGGTALAPALAAAPLDSLRITAGFGELRPNHVHAGLDLSTGGRVGAAVRAPLPGSVERVRASGVGYGRSLYVRADDGRLLVFGHLDAFAPPLAAYVDSAQCATERYEADLWPAAGRFRFATGDTVAWSGESGAGPPHLHFEIRHDDFALAPLRAGVTVPGGMPPAISWLTLEPLDEASFVARRAAPFSLAPRARAETLLVEGAVRAIVRTRSGGPGGAETPAWSTALEWNGARLEARLDSISWAGEMSQVDQVFDRGRIANHEGLVMYRPAGVSLRFFEGGGEWDGVIRVAAGDPPRPLRIVAREADGSETERTVWLRGPSPAEGGPNPSPPAISLHASFARGPRWSFSSLPGARLRVRLAEIPAGVRDVRFALRSGGEWRATPDGAAWCAVLPVGGIARGDASLHALAEEVAGLSWTRVAGVTLCAAGDSAAGPAVFPGAPWATLALDGSRLFEPGTVALHTGRGLAAAGGELRALTPGVLAEPAGMPLRRGALVSLALPAGAAPARADLYRREGSGRWEPLRARFDAATRTFSSESANLGEFALLRDDVAPRLRLHAPPRVVPSGHYPRWQLVAGVIESGSGVDADASAFFVDGRRVPSEWDPEEGQLRWRPLRAPSPGEHEYRVRVADRAGNVTGREGRFVLDSGGR